MRIAYQVTRWLILGGVLVGTGILKGAAALQKSYEQSMTRLGKHTRCSAGAQVNLADLRLVPPIAGAFWTPLQPPPYDPALPLYPVTYSDSEKQAQLEAYVKECQGLKDAIAAGKSGYTFPPGVYRSKLKISIEVCAPDCRTAAEGVPSCRKPFVIPAQV